MTLSKQEQTEKETELKQVNSLIVALEMRRGTLLKQLGEAKNIESEIAKSHMDAYRNKIREKYFKH
jgi:hypothetical protein